MKKILLSGLISGIVNIIIGNALIFLTTNILNNILNLQIPELFKFPNNLLLPILSVISAAIWTIAYSIIRNGIPGKSGIIKGLIYGFIIWFVSSIPLNLLEYLANNQIYYLLKIIPELIQYLIVCLIIGIVYENLFKKEAEVSKQKSEWRIATDFHWLNTD